MNSEFKYEEPKLLELGAFFLQGDEREFEDVSVDSFGSDYEEEEHENYDL